MWFREFSRHLLPFWIQRAPLSIQLSANVPGKVAKDSLYHSHGRHKWCPRLLSSDWTSPGCCGYLRHEPADRRSLLFPPSLSLLETHLSNKQKEKIRQLSNIKIHFINQKHRWISIWIFGLNENAVSTPLTHAVPAEWEGNQLSCVHYFWAIVGYWGQSLRTEDSSLIPKTRGCCLPEFSKGSKWQWGPSACCASCTWQPVVWVKAQEGPAKQQGQTANRGSREDVVRRQSLYSFL